MKVQLNHQLILRKNNFIRRQFRVSFPSAIDLEACLRYDGPLAGDQIMIEASVSVFCSSRSALAKIKSF